MATIEATAAEAMAKANAALTGYRVVKCGWSVQMLEKSSSYSSETSFDSGKSSKNNFTWFHVKFATFFHFKY